MGDSPLSIAASAVQFLGIRSAIQDIFTTLRFVHTSGEYNADLTWLAGALKWELESLDEWGMYAGLKRSSSSSADDDAQGSEMSFLASYYSAHQRVQDTLVVCRATVEELKQLLQIDDLKRLLPPTHDPASQQNVAPNVQQTPPAPPVPAPAAATSAGPAPQRRLSLFYTETITDSDAVVAAAQPRGTQHYPASLNRIVDLITRGKQRLTELVRRLSELNRRLREELPNPDAFYRCLASALVRDLTPEELRLIRPSQPSDTAFVRVLASLARDKENARLLLQSTVVVDADFKRKLTQRPAMDAAQPPDTRLRGLARRRAEDGGHRVLVEWKRVAQVARPGFRAGVMKRLDNLARCLHVEEDHPRSDFHMMACDGWFEDDVNWLGIVYRVPPGVDHTQEPRSLADIMSDPVFLPIPSLGTRFTLANQLAISLQQYHAIGWFHKAFNSSNILFFFDPTTMELRLEEPYIVGFGSSRPKVVEATEGVDPYADHLASLYQHPDIDHGFRAAYDVYALGCVMLELAFWDTLLSMEREISPPHKEHWMEALQGKAADLGPKVGEIYQDAVGWCLCDAVRCRDDKEVMRRFVPNVERQLASLHV